MKNNITAVIFFMLAIFFVGLGIGLKKRRKSAYFFRYKQVSGKTIEDITGYFSAIGSMWEIFGFAWGVAGIFAYVTLAIGRLFAVLLTTAGTAVLAWRYRRLRNKSGR